MTNRLESGQDKSLKKKDGMNRPSDEIPKNRCSDAATFTLLAVFGN